MEQETQDDVMPEPQAVQDFVETFYGNEQLVWKLSHLEKLRQEISSLISAIGDMSLPRFLAKPNQCKTHHLWYICRLENLLKMLCKVERWLHTTTIKDHFNQALDKGMFYTNGCVYKGCLSESNCPLCWGKHVDAGDLQPHYTAQINERKRKRRYYNSAKFLSSGRETFEGLEGLMKSYGNASFLKKLAELRDDAWLVCRMLKVGMWNIPKEILDLYDNELCRAFESLPLMASEVDTTKLNLDSLGRIMSVSLDSVPNISTNLLLALRELREEKLEEGVDYHWHKNLLYMDYTSFTATATRTTVGTAASQLNNIINTLPDDITDRVTKTTKNQDQGTFSHTVYYFWLFMLTVGLDRKYCDGEAGVVRTIVEKSHDDSLKILSQVMRVLWERRSKPEKKRRIS